MLIRNFQLGKCIYQSQRTKIYRSQIEGSTPTIVKMLALDVPSVFEKAQIEQEYKILAGINHEGIIKTYDIEQLGKHTVLLLEDIQAISITEILSRKGLDVKTCLKLAIKICDALSEVHRNNVIHKDINPNNIIWNETTDELKIIDFNISTTLSREVVEAKNPNVLEGTLPYLSPEQTGRMNRAIDYRSDFYSLGTTLYHMLTGNHPFKSKDSLGYVHAHIALTPIQPHELKKRGTTYPLKDSSETTV